MAKLVMTPSPLPYRILTDKTTGQWLVNIEARGPSTAGCPASEGTVRANFSKRCFAFPTFLLSNFLKKLRLPIFGFVSLEDVLCCFFFGYVRLCVFVGKLYPFLITKIMKNGKISI